MVRNFVDNKSTPEILDDKMIQEIKIIDYPKANKQLDKIEIFLRNFQSNEAYKTLIQILDTRTHEEFKGREIVFQFEEALKKDLLERFSAQIRQEITENPSSQVNINRLREFKIWQELNQSFQKFKKILGIPYQELDLNDEEVRIYFWKPTTVIETGHVSLKTKKIYASFWPEKIPDIKTGYSSQGTLQSYADDVAEFAKDRRKDSGKEDQEIVISGFNVAEINKRFLEFKAEVDKGNIRWSLLSHRLIDRWYPNTNRQNCSGLVAELLEAGDVRKLISGFRRRNKITSTIGRFAFTKELGPLWMALPALYLRDKPGFSSFIPALICGLPMFSLFLCLNRFKRQHILEPNLSIIGDILTAMGISAPFLGLSLAIDKLGGSYLLEGHSVISIIVISILAFINWYIFDKASEITDFIIRCCYSGTDILIRPNGIYELALYAKKIGRITDRLKSKINMEFTAAYSKNAGAGLLGVFFGKYSSNHIVMGVNQGGLIGLHIGILLNTMINLCLRKYLKKLYWDRFYLYDPMNKRHWPDTCTTLDDILYERDNNPDIELAENDYHYLCEAFNDVLYFPGFSITVLLGMSWGILMAGYFANNSSQYFPFILGGSGLGGFLTVAGGYQLTRKTISCCKKNEKSESEIKESLILDEKISDNSYSFLSVSRSKEKSGEDELLIQKHSKCFCAIL